jgi:O-acetyl-ADP-ribose deacetylase (regulator of RNase III)
VDARDAQRLADAAVERARGGGGVLAVRGFPRKEDSRAEWRSEAVVVAAVRAGVEAVVILDGRRPHAMLVELFTEYGAGTLVKA